MNFYELSVLRISHSGLAIAAPSVRQYVSQPDAQGVLLGIWKTIAGNLNDVIVLRGFDSRPDLAQERERARRSSNPFCCGDTLLGLEMASFVPFGASLPVAPGPHGPLYKLSTYSLKPSALTLAERVWSDALGEGVCPDTIVAMYPMDGSPRVVELAACRSGSEGRLEQAGLSLSIADRERLCWPSTMVSVMAALEASPLS